MNRPSLLALTLSALLLAVAAPVRAADEGHDHSHEAEQLGKVDFPISCAPAAQPDFTRGVALLHSFGYARAVAAFGDASAKDSACGMAQWGVAMSYFHAIWGPPTEQEFAAGRAAAAKAAELSAKTERERDWITAVQTLYAADGPHVARVDAFEKAMAQLQAKHPEDHEASILHALSILGVAYNSPPDKSYARQKQAAAILDQMLAVAPEHPGIAHYMIHSFDYPALAELALNAARAYAKIAPDAPHALHMPSHIFTRLGLWGESIDSNLASAETARRQLEKTDPGATSFNALHAMDYLAYAYLQTGQDAKAAEVVERTRRVSALDSPELAAGYALAAIPARFALERGRWADAEALAVEPAAFPWEKFPAAEAIVHFARCVGAARAGDLATARQALDRLTALQQSLQGKKGFDWATQVEIQRRSAEGWLRRAEGKDEEAVALLRSAADLEDSADKHPVTPGSVLPAREQLADLLAELGRPDEAVVEYEASVRTAPARFRTFWGAAQAAERAGDAAKARSYYAKLVELGAASSPARPELLRAQSKLGTAAPSGRH